MQIKLLKRTAEAIGEIYFRPWGINKDSWGWKEEDYLDLATMERDKIDALRKLFAEHEDVKGVKVILQDIDTWLNVLHDKKGVFVARLNYNPPSRGEQALIWRILADASKIEMSDEVISQIVAKSHGITGRDVKNLLKLANLLAISRGESITAEMVEFAKKFKPTGN